MSPSNLVLPRPALPEAHDAAVRPPLPGRTARIICRSLPVGFFAVYAALSVLRHLHLQSTGFDLGIFEQAVRAYAEGRAPVSELKGPGFNLLGDHFHPVLATLAPLYAACPSPLTLLIAQAALLACSVVPVARLGIRTLGVAAGTGIAVAYGLSFGLAQAAGFDFHEVAFAVPLLAFSLEQLVRRRWVPAVAFAFPLVLVKEDLPLTVAAIGVHLVLQGRRRLGGAVVLGSAVILVLVIGVIVPAFNPGHTYTYLSSAGGDTTDPFSRLLLPATKWGTIALLLAPTALLALRSPLLLVAVPTLAWRFWSTTPSYWGTTAHYSAVLMPVVFIAFIDGLRRVRASRPTAAGRRRLTGGAVAVSLLVTVCVLPFQPLSDLARTETWRSDPQADAVRRVLARIPDGADVAASNRLAPQLTGRTRVFLFPHYPGGPGARPQWVAVTDRPEDGPVTAEQEAGAMGRLADRGYAAVARGGGVTLYRAGS
ncbi:DUF2079 domain-containing protein [Streptomyces rimosus]|uniref:DUF2079 domain-containing protein n=1 Tax=Streptomyces rimosus TaxID=1927 RepID=UPI00067E5394|nr:DUF2079 domain-containing protein [Streptomyces rimosus]